MSRIRVTIGTFVTLAAALLWAQAGAGAEAVLDNRTLLRTWMVERTPVVIGADGEFKEAATPHEHRGKVNWTKIGDFQSPLPAASWREASFDDSEWSRQRVPVEKGAGSSNRNLGALHSATRSSMICARAKFLVDDPAQAGDLTLSVKYVGGLAVFLNGKEIARRHLPQGELKPDTLAEAYPEDIYITADGKSMQHRTEDWEAYKRDEARFNRRYRTLDKVTIPAALLRQGLNVLALQLYRAPVHEQATKVHRRGYGGLGGVYGLWAYVGLHGFSLTSEKADGIRPNLGVHARGVQIWNCAPFDTLRLDSFGDPGAEPMPVEIDVMRAGACSGRFVVSSDKTIENLKVELSELTSEDGKSRLPPEAVELRHGRPAHPRETPRPPPYFDGLLPGVPAKVEYVTKPVAGALVPVWVTVRSAKEAVPGLYKGRITVTAAGLDPVVVPLRCRVHGWTLPEPAERRVKTLNVFSPYSVAGHYKVPLWSDRHFELLERSYCLAAAIGARRVDIDMVPGLRSMEATEPVEESMFRLVPKADGPSAGSASSPQAGSGQARYDYDFSVIEKVFDLVEKTMGRPLPLVVNCWGDDRGQDPKTKQTATGWFRSTNRIPVRDPKTGKITSIENPPPGSEENFAFWNPILTELRKRIEKRGWFDVTAIGHQSYCWVPHPSQVDIALRIWPDGAYGFTSHNGTLNSSFKGSKGRMPVFSSECVWTEGKLEHRGYRRLLAPGRDKSIWNSVSRNGHLDRSGLIGLLCKPEQMIMQGHDGLGYLCMDFLPQENPNARHEHHRYPVKVMNGGGVIGYSTKSLLAAGPDGAIATGRYEMFREGVQQCEAILYLQRAINGGKLPKPLADKVNAYLDERSRASMNAAWPSDRRDLDRRLLVLAAEAEGNSGP
jgi:hypothetical protein